MKTNLLTRFVLLTGIGLLVYGYLAILAGCYFFWESKSIGWLVIGVGVLFFLAHRIDYKNEAGKSTVLEKIGICLISFAWLLCTALLTAFYFSDPFDAAEKFVQKNTALTQELGTIQGLGFVATGDIRTQDDYGNATLEVLVKGEKKFAYKTLYLSRTPESSDWQVEEIQ